MKKIFCDKRTPIIAEAVFALLVIISMFFCFSYYTWSGDTFKISGFGFLGIFLRDYGFFEICLLVGLIFSVLILIGNVLRLLNKKLVEQKWFSVVIAFLSVIILISGVVLFVGADGHIAITTIEACGTSEIFRGAGSYMYLIFPAVIFIVAILEIFCTFNKSSKERGWNENI